MSETPDYPPFLAEEEQAMLGFIMLKSDCLDSILDKHKSNGVALFYDSRHQALFEFIVGMRERHEPIDDLTVCIALKEYAKEVGGLTYVREIIDLHTPNVQVFPFYLKSLEDMATKRKLLKLGMTLQEKAKDPMFPVDGLFSLMESHLDQLVTTAGCFEVKEAVMTCINDTQERYNRRGQLGGITTGLVDLDSMLDGLQPGEQTLIAARPSIGKTALGMNVVEAACIKGGVPTLVVTCEMSPASLVRRMCSGYTGVGIKTMRTGQLTDDDFGKIKAFTYTASKAPLWFVDGVSGISASTVCSTVKRFVKNHGIKLVVIDYLQKLRANMRHEKRTYEIGEVSGQLQALARHTKVALLTIAQLNRESDKDKGRSPRLSDLADSGQIERDADTVILMHRDKNDPSDAYLYVAKARDGEIGTVKTYFNSKRTRFENAA